MPRRTKFTNALWIVALAFALPARAQSTRTGWGSTPYHDPSGAAGVTFRVWAPNATSVSVPGSFNAWSTTATPLVEEKTNNVPDGVWSADVPAASANAQYKYYLVNGSGFYKHDPRSRWVVAAGTAPGANDIVYDPTNFNWTGDTLKPPVLNDLVIYELHVGTFASSASPNRFVAATNKLDYLKSLGINAVEVMPVVEFGNSGTSWGYNPAQQFAVDNAQYGGPDAFKTFVRACHARGLAVLLDVVHNHYGPDLLDMWNFDGWAGANSIGGGGIYFYQSNTNDEITPWGYTRPNCAAPQVASFVQDTFTMWLNEYHVDGFRWDSPGALISGNDGSYISANGSLVNSINSFIHAAHPGVISIAEDVYNSFGFNSAWDTSFPYYVTPVLTNTVDANRDMSVIANAIQSNVRYGGAAGAGRVAFLETHDVVGDLNGGNRLVTAIDPVTPSSYRARKLSTLGAAVTMTAPGLPMIFQGQEMLENQSFDSGRLVDWTKTNTYSRVVQLYRDLIGARRNLLGRTPGLEGDQCSVYDVNNTVKLVAFHRWKSAATNQDAIVIANFNAARVNIVLPFPSVGTWYVQFNSDSTNYGSDYGNYGSSIVTASGNPVTGAIAIGPYSALILSQVPPTAPQLSIQLTNSALNISWPAAYFGWTLQSSGSPAANAAWSAFSSAPYHTNSGAISVNFAPGATNTFYRLQSSP